MSDSRIGSPLAERWQACSVYLCETSMKSEQAKIGSIWAVPAAGPTARCLVLGPPREIYKGVPEFRVLPLTEAEGASAGLDELALSAGASAHQRAYIGHLYNLRSVPISALSECVDLLVDTKVIDQIRTAYRQYLATPPSIGWLEARSRRRAIAQWQPVSGRLLEGLCQIAPEYEFDMEQDWASMMTTDWLGVVQEGAEFEASLQPPTVLSAGADRVEIRVVGPPRMIVVYLGPQQQPVQHQATVIERVDEGRIRDWRPHYSGYWFSPLGGDVAATL